MISRLLALADGVGVQTKIMGIVVGLILMLGLGATYELRQHNAVALGHELDERAVSIARDLAARSTDLILTNNSFGLYELARDTLENNQDVRYVFIIGPDGAPLVHTFGGSLPRELLEANTVSPQARYHLEILSSQEGLIRDAAVPIFDGRAGIARVGLSDRRIQAELESSTRELLLMTGAVGLAGLGIAYLLTLVLTRPISEMVRVVRGVEQGNLESRVHPRTRDEIGVLGHAFNAMAESLSKSMAQTEEYNARLLRRNRELSALNMMASAVGQSRTLSDVLGVALDRSIQLSGTSAGWVWLLEEDRESLHLAYHLGLPSPPSPLHGKTPHNCCHCRSVLANCRATPIGTADGRCRLLEEKGFGGGIGIPLVAKGQVLGIMKLAMNEPREFSTEELELLSAVGSQIGVAIENARLWEELLRRQEVQRQLLDNIIGAQEEERKRVARELHDETSQLLTSLVLGLDGLAAEPMLPETARERAGRLREVASGALEEVHHLALELRPSALDDAGLVPGISRYLREYRLRHGLEVDFRTVGTDGLRLIPAAETAVFRIVQEALTNVARHAHAQGVTVLLERRGPNLVTVVEDDGCGFDPEAVAVSPLRERLGLAGMAERAALVGGRLALESRPGQGTTVFVTVPLAENSLERPANEEAQSATR